MSWLSNLVSKNSSDTSQTQVRNANNQLYLSLDSTKINFLLVDEAVEPNKIVYWEEFQLGPIEDLKEGEPVRDVFGSLLKLFTSHKEKLQNIQGVSLAIPAEGVFFKNVEVPKIADADRQKLILAEIKKALPVDFSQVLFAQNDLGEKRENMVSYFCVGIQKMLFENYKDLFAKFNLNPYFEIEVFSLARIVAADDLPKLILQIGKLSTFLVFLKGQIIQDVKLLEFGLNDIVKNLSKNLDLDFGQAQFLIKNLGVLKDANRIGGKIVDEYVKEFEEKIAKGVSLHILEYEKRQNVEIQEVVVSGDLPTVRIKNILQEEFDAELKVEFVTEENFKDFSAENFSLEELKRYAQCFGLALRSK